MDAFNGDWRRRGLIQVPVIPPAPVGRPPLPTFGDWDPTSMREAHRRFNGGDRSMAVVEGERVYQSGRKRSQRAGHLNPVDRAWAEREAVRWSWVLDEHLNRR